MRDRQGQPVAAARVFLPSREGSTTTDGQGRFELAGVRAGRTFVLAERAGFRFQGWPVYAAGQTDGLELTLARENEEPEPKIAPAAPALSDQELRVLARRLVEPYVAKGLEAGSDFERMTALTALFEVEPERVIELLNGGQIQTPMAVARVRSLLAFEAAARDPEGALKLMEAITEPRLRASGFVALARALPNSEKARKQALLERAAVEMRTFPQPVMKLRLIAQIMKSWLDLGMSEKARPLAQEGQKIIDSFSAERARQFVPFQAQLARLEPGLVLERIEKISEVEIRAAFCAEVAIQLALEHPAEAERSFGLMEPRSGWSFYLAAMQMCRRLAKVDGERAERIAAAVETPGRVLVRGRSRRSVPRNATRQRRAGALTGRSRRLIACGNRGRGRSR